MRSSEVQDAIRKGIYLASMRASSAALNEASIDRVTEATAREVTAYAIWRITNANAAPPIVAALNEAMK